MKIKTSAVIVMSAILGLMVARAGAQRELRPTERVPPAIKPEQERMRPAMPMADPPGARYYSIPPYEFTKNHFSGSASPYIHDYKVELLIPGQTGKVVPGTHSFGAGVHLPDGAVIWGWRAWVEDDNPGAGSLVGLRKAPLSSGSRSWIGNSQATSDEQDSDETMLLQQTSLDEAVENRRYYYTMEFQVSGSSVGLYGVVIIYTMPVAAN